MDLGKESLKMNKENKGKLATKSKISLKTKQDLSLVYTPGVAEVCREIAANKNNVYEYTMKANSVAVVTDGSAVLGLGNIGAEASLPVMEGKCVLFKELANIDAFPICISTQNDDEIINIVKNITPAFGGINLEDIAAPRCFKIEEALLDLGIPLIHDDQHGTSVVVLAALINAAKVVGKNIDDLKIVINCAGAAGTAVAKILLCVNVDKKICTSVKEIVLCDSKGIIYDGRGDLNEFKKEMAKITNSKRKGTLKDALKGADVFIGLSKGNLLTAEDLKAMNKDAIIFAMANPAPEIMPDEAKKVAAIVGTGRSDFPNQINNSLSFPGVFRGALDSKAARINNEMKIAAAKAIANCCPNPTRDNILPYTLDKSVVPAVAAAVAKAARESGVCRE